MATDEGSLLAAARAEGKVLVAPGAEIALTKPLYVNAKLEGWGGVIALTDTLRERRPSGPRAAVVAGAEGRVWAVGAQAWSAPR